MAKIYKFLFFFLFHISYFIVRLQLRYWIGLISNLSLTRIKWQSIWTKFNPNFNSKYSIQVQLNLIFLNSSWVQVVYVRLKFVRLDSD